MILCHCTRTKTHPFHFFLFMKGCSVNGRCELENAEWSVNRGESCTKQSCKKILHNNVDTYKVVSIADGK